jgi:hypothetical protein
VTDVFVYYQWEKVTSARECDVFMIQEVGRAEFALKLHFDIMGQAIRYTHAQDKATLDDYS